MSGAWAVIVAAGRGERMGASVNKVLLPLCGKPVLRHTAEAFLRAEKVEGLIVVASEGEMDAVKEILGEVKCKPCLVCSGGQTRQQSVRNGLLCARKAGARIVLVHDGARPFVSQALIEGCIEQTKRLGSAVAAARVTDTVKSVQGEEVIGTFDRETLRTVQTPQAFFLEELLSAHEKAQRDGVTVTDDAAVMEYAGKPVYLYVTDEKNIKLTTPEDLKLAEMMMREREETRFPCTGYGYDVHKLTAGRRLVLCGVEIPYEKGLDGHSDADVAVHALMDALLGAACMGDIGRLYPDNDPAYEGIDSMLLLRDVLRRLGDRRVLHADVTIICQRPKLKDYMPQMVGNLEKAMPGANVNVKATTTEQLGFEGRGEGISAQAVATIW